VHATPPLVFALAVEGLLRVYRASAEATPATRLAAAQRTPKHEHKHDSAHRAPSDITAPTTATTLSPATPPTNTPVAPQSATPLTARQRLAALLEEQPSVTGGEAARTLGIDPSHARKLLRELRPDTSSGASY